MNTPLPAGKLPSSLLQSLLAELPTSDPQLLLGPAVGEDAAVIDLCAVDGCAPQADDRLLVAKSDPITFATDEIGYYAVNVCANDLAVTGATPRFYLPTILLPAGHADAATVQGIFRQIGAACRALNIVVAGGHTEVTHTVPQPVIAGSMLGEVERQRIVSSSGCQPGDCVLLAGVAPIEGASIIAREKRDALIADGWDPARIDKAADYLHEPGISVVRPAQLAADAGWATAMHDPTEGGIATGLLELTMAADVGLRVDLDAITVPPLAQELCAAFDLDPLGVIASGALLATAAPEHADPLLQQWRAHGIDGACIGRILPPAEGVTAHRSGAPVEFPRFGADEIVKIFA